MNIPNPFGRVKAHDKVLLAKNLSAMLEAGLSLSRALAVIERQTKNKKLKDALSIINQDLAAGKTFNETISKFPNIFSPLFISMVKAGEESGSLSASLQTVGLQLERASELTRKIRGAMMYPGIILLAMCGIAFFMLTNVVPAITDTFKEMNVELPTTTRFVIFVSDFLKNNIILTLVGIVVAAFCFWSFAKTRIGKRTIHWVILRIPIINVLVKETNAARTARTMSSLLTAGVDILAAVEITQDVLQNVYYKDILGEAKPIVERGEPLSTVFSKHENLYPPFVGEMLAVGEETGQMSKMLLGVAVYYEDEVEQKTKDMSSIIEPFLMIIIGAAVGFFAISMLGPIYSIGDAIK
jgi:type IV pilus assembly protein PilC